MECVGLYGTICLALVIGVLWISGTKSMSMEEGKRKMMFEVGKEYRTRDGSVAQVSANCNDMQVSNAITSKKEVK